MYIYTYIPAVRASGTTTNVSRYSRGIEPRRRRLFLSLSLFLSPYHRAVFAAGSRKICSFLLRQFDPAGEIALLAPRASERASATGWPRELLRAGNRPSQSIRSLSLSFSLVPRALVPPPFLFPPKSRYLYRARRHGADSARELSRFPHNAARAATCRAPAQFSPLAWSPALP
jgi:hypothetical protein